MHIEQPIRPQSPEVTTLGEQILEFYELDEALKLRIERSVPSAAEPIAPINPRLALPPVRDYRLLFPL